MLFKSMLIRFHLSRNFVSLWLLVYSFTPNIWYDFNHLEFIVCDALTCDLFWRSVLCVIEENVCFAVVFCMYPLDQLNYNVVPSPLLSLAPPLCLLPNWFSDWYTPYRKSGALKFPVSLFLFLPSVLTMFFSDTGCLLLGFTGFFFTFLVNWPFHHYIMYFFPLVIF